MRIDARAGDRSLIGALDSELSEMTRFTSNSAFDDAVAMLSAGTSHADIMTLLSGDGGNDGGSEAGASPIASTGSTATKTTTLSTTIVLPPMSNTTIAADISSHLQGNTLSYASVLAILQDASIGGMTAAKFASLQTFAGDLNISGGISCSAYVAQLTKDVVNGNSANAWWNGGSSTATALGNLSASSTQLQMSELIGKWFLGTDLPSLNLSQVGGPSIAASYQMSSLPLYGSTGSPSYKDVNQGAIGDCYFLSSLGEVALKDPHFIQNMITNNGNGTYGVRFFINGQADYVTVNEALPTMSGAHYADGSSLEFANGTQDNWVALVEKAFAQLNEQTAAPHGYVLRSASDSYAGIVSGTAYALTEITGQAAYSYSLSPSSSASTLSSIMSTITNAFKSGQEVLMSTPSANNGDLIGGHMYMVTDMNAQTGAISIQNPWDAAYSGPLHMSFTDTIQQLAAANCTLYVTAGAKLA